MTVQDLQVNCSVRSVLCRHWIDSRRLNYTTRRGHVHLSGEVQMLGAYAGKQVTAIALTAVENELRQMRDIKSTQFHFTNWLRDDDGNWRCTEKEEPRAPLASPAGPQPLRVIGLELGPEPVGRLTR